MVVVVDGGGSCEGAKVWVATEEAKDGAVEEIGLKWEVEG